MRRLLLLLVLFLATGCPAYSTQDDGGTPFADAGDDDPQSRYTYAGCEDAGSYGCPNQLVFYCAMETIRARHDSCEVAADCADATADNCVGWGECSGVSVRADSVAAYEAEARTEIARYCDGGGCASSGLCGAGVPERMDCISGRCRWIWDAGQ